jgi:acyl-CoA thioester hydrolase
MEFRHKTPIQIRFNDIDIVGHVNNAVYSEYFDKARLEYFKTVFRQQIDWNKAGFVIAAIHIDFFSPVFLDDNIFVATIVESIGEKSLNMAQLIFRDGDEEPVARGNTVMVSFDYMKRSSIEMPVEWKMMLEGFEDRELA